MRNSGAGGESPAAARRRSLSYFRRNAYFMRAGKKGRLTQIKAARFRFRTPGRLTT